MFTLLALLLTLFQWQPSAEVVVELVTDKEGLIRAAIYNHPDSFLINPQASINVEINALRNILKFSNLTPGTYAISLYLDLNRNGELDQNFFRIPQEPFAFSNNVRAWVGPPRFTKASFQVSAGNHRLIIKI